MNEWKELEIDNLPCDIITGDYDFEYLYERFHDYEPCQPNTGWQAIKTLNSAQVVRYRKPEPKAPNHEEIMTLWWKTGTKWKKVIQYDTEEGWYRLIDERTAVSTLWFINMESATLPPEAPCPK